MFYHSDMHLKHLETIKNIKFTPREIDVIACMLSGKAAGVIASLLGISARTIEAHMLNIRIKLGCSSRNGVIEFIESTDKLHPLKQHYQNLLIDRAFQQSLKRIGTLVNQKSPVASIIHWRFQSNTLPFMQSLKYYLKLAGIKVTSKIKETPYELIVHQAHSSKSSPVNYIMYVFTTALMKNSLYDLRKNALNHSSLDPHPIFILFDIEECPSSISPTGYVDFRDPNTLHSSVFSLLKKLLPAVDLNKIIQEFDAQYKLLHGNIKEEPTEIGSQEINPLRSAGNIFQHIFSMVFKERGKYPILLGISILIGWLLIFKVDIGEASQSKIVCESARSDLLIPIDYVLLNRPKLIAQIEEKLKGHKGIQTIVLVGIVGIEGIGKTTLARQFGRQYKSSIVWELNAETKNSLMNSFKDLAHALAKTKEQKEDLEFIKAMQNPEEKEHHFLSFVKRHLNTHPNWLLIYDNVDTFAEVRNYLPQDDKIWGHGRVIITTRDSNIQNTSSIGSRNVIQLGELSQSEALTLFSKILHNSESANLSPSQQKEDLAFLSHIPPFPLDVSVAAYYIRDTHMRYEKYLEEIGKYNQAFHTTQENFLKESNDYKKTRYGIISLAFKKLIESNTEFKDLLLLICLLDSQHVPKDLLDLYKNSSTTDSFIHTLRKYSLITSESLTGEKDKVHTFSLHRSIQDLSKNFLLNILREDEKQHLIGEMVKTIKTFYETYAEINHTNIMLLIPHVETFLKNLTTISMPKALKEKYEVNLLFVLGSSHYKCSGSYILAKKYLAQVFEKAQGKTYFTNYMLYHLLQSLGYICIDLHDIEDALFYSQKSMKYYEKTPNSEILAAANLRIMGGAYFRLNNIEKAKYYLEAALLKISKVGNNKTNKESKAEELSKIYTQLASLYSKTYINGTQAEKAEYYAQKALETLNASQPFYKKSKKPEKKLSCYIAINKARLGQVYCCLGKYKDAIIKGFRESQYIIDNSLDNCSHTLLKGKMYSNLGEALLREGQLTAAEQKLTESIYTLERLAGKKKTLIPKLFRAEARIRLGKLEEAYEDCNAVFRTEKKSKTNYANLMYITCHYHAAFIKYKQSDLKTSIEHFTDFFQGMKIFCKGFLTEKAYKELEDKGVFTTPFYNPKQAKEDSKTYLKHSIDIFTAIYGLSHPFVQDYCIPNYNKSTKSWLQIF